MPEPLRKARRKVFGMVVGIITGVSLSLYSKKSPAFLGSFLSPEKILEMFMKQAGGVLMRFLGNRLVSNTQEAFEKYSEKTNEKQQEDNQLLGELQAQSDDLLIKSITNSYTHQLELEASIPPNHCIIDQQSSSNQSLSVAVDQLGVAIADRNSEHQLQHSGSPGAKTSYNQSAIKSLLEDDGPLQIKELDKLYSCTTISDVKRSEQELALLAVDIALSSEEFTRIAASVKMGGHGKAASVDIIMKELGTLLAQRLPTNEAPSEILNLLNRDRSLQYQGRKLSSIERLSLEVDCYSNSDPYLQELTELPSLTTAMIHLNHAQALTAKLNHELLKVRQSAAKIKAIMESVNG